MRCRGLHEIANPAYLSHFLSLPCPMLHRSAFPVVSEWYQEAIMRRGFHFELHLRPEYEKPRPWSISGSAVITIEMS